MRAEALPQRQADARRGPRVPDARTHIASENADHMSKYIQQGATRGGRCDRRRYLDPLTGKDDWAPIQLGQARPATGFFGQKITNTSGMSPSGPGLGPSRIGTSLGNSSSSQSGIAGTDPNPSNSAGSSGATASARGGAAGAPFGLAGSAGNPLSSDQLSGRTFGGGAIVGVSVPSEKESLKEFQQKNHYKDWQFVYDPTMDSTLRGGTGAGAATGIPGGMPGIVPGQGIGGPNSGLPGTLNGPLNNPSPNPMSGPPPNPH